MNQLEAIRNSLNLSQTEFGRVLGAKAQSTYQRWEAQPDMPASRDALEKAKAYFKKKSGKDWIDMPSIQPNGGIVTRDEFLKWAGRIEALEAAIRALSPGLDAVKDLDERVQALENRKRPS